MVTSTPRFGPALHTPVWGHTRKEVIEAENVLFYMNIRIEKEIGVMSMKKKIKTNILPDNIIGAINIGDVEQINNWKNAENINYVDKYGRSLIFYAILLKNKGIFKELLDTQPNLNLKDKEGWSALHFAAQLYLTDIAELLIENGAELEATDNYGNTPLFRATYESKGNGDMIKLLLSKGADPNEENNFGISPLKLAAKIANYNVKQFF